MALTLLYKPTLVRIDSIELDASISESHVGEVEVTEHPVEQGANVTDHVRPKPDTLTIEGFVSNTPLNRAQNKRAVESQGFRLSTTSERDVIVGQPGNAETAYTKLRELKDSGTLITVTTKLRTYDNMVIKSLSVPRDAKVGDALKFSATFQRITIVQNKTVFLPIRQSNHKPLTKKGKKPSKPVAAAEAGSWLKSGTDGVGLTDSGSGL